LTYKKDFTQQPCFGQAKP